MTMLTVRNVRGVDSADIDLAGPLVLVAGLNRVGKTSIALALQACLTRNPTPVTGKKNRDGALMVSEGQEGGKAQITDAGAHYAIFWPKCEASTKGNPDALPYASQIAAGLEQFTAMSAEARARVFADTFKALPTREDLEHAIAEAQIQVDVDRVWKVIEDDSWDHAARLAADKAKESKGAWQTVTGKPRWGENLGVTWRPEGWDTELEDEHELSLQDAVDQARERRDKAISESAVGEAERARLEAEAAKVGDLKAEEERNERSQESAEQQLFKAKEKRADLPEKADTPPHRGSCPSCGTADLHFPKGHQDGAEMEVWEGLSPEEIEKRQGEIRKADEAVAKAREREEHARHAVTTSLHKLSAAQQAQEKLKELGKAKAGEAAPADDDVRQAEANLEMWRSWIRALELHDQITKNEAIRGLLEPDGLRKKKLAETLDLVNRHLAEISKTMRVPPVSIDADMQVWMGRRPYVILSGSEQWRARVAIQLEIAKHDGSSMVVVDGRIGMHEGPGLEILAHEQDREGFLMALLEVGVPALVVLALRDSDPDRLPDLAAAGCGTSYWLEGRKAVPVSMLRREAA